SGLATVSLITAVIGMYWDIALHIGVGRDEGPLANPAHYFILAGLFGIFSAGFLAIVMPKDNPGPTSIRVGRDWHAPLGGVLICACGAFSLIGFPLDDVWHRLFGQDVTLWGPTHLMLIGGAAMTLVGIAVLLVEGARNVGARSLPLILTIPLCGGLLLGLATFQAEFDFGVPQFRFVFQPILIMLAAGVGLVAARAFAGRGAALGAVAFFLAVRGVLALLVGPVLGETTPHMPLFVVEALVVEAVAFAVAPRERPLAFGLWAGAAIGTVGLASEWAWSHAWMPLPWPSELFPEGALLGFAAAMSGALLGAWAGSRLSLTPAPGLPSLRRAAVVGAAGVAALVAFALYKPADEGVRAQVALTDVRGGADRTVNADVRLSPTGAADDAEWLTATAWQGEGLVVDRLRKVGPGHYRTTEPIPVNGNWKALIRLHNGNSLTAVPVFLPRDQAIPAKEVPARAEFTRTFVADHQILQREQKAAASWLTIAAYLVVVAISLALLALLVWGLHRLASGGGGAPRPPREAAARAPELAGSHA
ncbi:MAG TPA: hypothetical protein VEX39_00675, partial [Thermoleophilaceae bacterium]|nr:hypothetical protein [Thermoleophilaceae bacterium]